MTCLASFTGACSSRGDTEAQKIDPTPWFDTAEGDSSTVWRPSTRPVWSLAKDAEGEEFVEIIGAAPLADSLIILADHRTGLLHYLSPSGRPIRRVGRRGSGPGEVLSLDAFGLADTAGVWLFDTSNQRLVIRGAAGEHRRTQAIRFPRGANSWPMVVGMLSTGDILMVERHLPIPMGQIPGSILRDSTRLLRFTPLNGTAIPLDTVPSLDIFVSPRGSARIYVAQYGPRLNVVRSRVEEGLLVGFSDSLKVSFLGGDGTNRDVVRRKFTPDPLSEATREDARRARGSGRFASDELPDALIPHGLPAFGRIVADEQGGVWLQEYQMDDSAQPKWAVFTKAGKLRGIVVLPSRFHLLLADGDEIVGLQRDDVGVEVVERWRLVADSVLPPS